MQNPSNTPPTTLREHPVARLFPSAIFRSRTTVFAALMAITGLQAAPLLAPGDPVFSYDLDTGGGNNGSSVNFTAVTYAAGQEPQLVLDGNTNTKHLNRSKWNAGLIITGFSPAAARSMVITTANDAPERDPASYIILGSNQPITSSQNSNGFADHWTFIAQGSLTLPAARFTAGTPVNLPNTASYAAYWIVFPDTKNSPSTALMQISELQLFTEPDGAGNGIFSSSNTAICTGWNSATPANENASRIIDGTNTKYLNFGENNSGFFVVPGVGPSVIDSFRITTANDSEARDPATWTLHGMAPDGIWSLIDSGNANLPAGRNVQGPLTPVANTSPYLAYRMTFPTVKNAGATNSMQIAEVQFFGTVLPAKDTDFDGMDDDWEILHGLLVGTNDGNGDPDADASTNLQEYQRGTLPNHPDSDADGLLDGVETKTGVWVSTSDTGTDPLNPDSDADNYSDGYEVARDADPNNAASIPVITWDLLPGTVGTGDGAVTGGTGDWNSSNGNWTLDGGVNNLAWDHNGLRTVAVFAGDPGTVTLTEPIGADRVIVETSGYTFTGSTLTLTGNDPRINTATGTTQMTQVLAGSSGFTKRGAGVLALTGATSNTYTGTTHLSGLGKILLAKEPGHIAIPGDILLNSTAFNGNNSGVVLAGNEQIADHAILSWAGLADSYFRMNGYTETVGGLSTAGHGNFNTIENRGFGDTAAYGDGHLILNTTGTDSYTFTGLIRNMDGGTGGGTIALTKTGTGSQTLGGNLGHSGPTSVNQGLLSIVGTLANSPVFVTDSGTLQGTGTIGQSVSVEAGGTLSPGTGGSGTLTTTAGVSLASGGSLVGSGTLAGPVTLGSGGLVANSGVITGAVTIQSGGSFEGSGTVNGTTLVEFGGTLAGSATFTNSLTVQSGGLLSPGGTTLATVTASNIVTLAGNTAFTVHKEGATLSSDRLAGFSSITYGGSLTVQATGDALALGDSFQLFAPAPDASIQGAFTSIDLPPLPSGLSWSLSNLFSTGEISIVDFAAIPVFSPPSGGYVGAQNVTITSTPGATIYYTTDGSEPTLASPSGPSPVSGLTVPSDATTTLKAFATYPGLTNSAVATALYQTITTAAWNVDDDGLWSETAKWASQVAPNGVGAPVDFTFPESLDTTVTLDSNRTVGSLTFANEFGFDWTIDAINNSVLSLATSSGTPTLAVLENTATLSAPLAGSQGLLKTGPGLLVLSGSNSYSGNTAIHGGIVTVGSLAANGNNSPLGTGPSLSFDGGTLRYTGGSVTAGNFNRSIHLGTGGGTLDFAGSGFWFTTGVLSGPGGLTKTGPSQLIVQANNTYEGITQIQEAEVQIRTLDSLGSTVGHTVVADGARLCAGGGLAGTIPESIVLNGMGGNGNGALQANDTNTAVTWAGEINLASDSGIGSTTGTIGFTLSGPISGPGGLSKVSANPVILSGEASNTYLGTTRLGGTGRLILAKSGGAIAIPGNIELSSTAWNGNNSGIVLAGNEQIADTALLTWTTSSFTGGNQQDSFLRLNGFTETIGGLVSTGNGGKAVIENRGFGDANTYGTGTLIIHTTGSSTYTFNGGFRDMDGGSGGGAIALVKSGTGTQILNGGMAATGPITVNEGTLVIQVASQSTGITVNSGGTLKGTGSLVGSLSVLSGGTLSPGNDLGTFSAGNATLAGTYACEIDAAAADRLTVNGNLDITGATLALTVLTAPTETSYILASYSGILTGSFAVTGLPEGYSVQVDTTEKQIKLVAGGPADGFAAWASANGLSGDPGADFDGDGLADSLEFVLGSSPTAAGGSGIAVSSTGDNFVVTFQRSHASKTADIALAIELGTQLQDWPTTYQVGHDTASSSPGVTVSDEGTHDLITLSVPRGTDTSKFARLRVSVTP